MDKYYSDDERRKEARIYRSGEIFVEVVSPEPNDTNAPEIIRCEVLDISATGAQLLADETLREDAVHTLVVDLDDYNDTYRMAGEVKWCKSSRDGYLVGFEFLDSEQTAIENWKDLLANFLN